MYVTGLGGAKLGQTNADDHSTAAETHRFTSRTPLLNLQLRKSPAA